MQVAQNSAGIIQIGVPLDVSGKGYDDNTYSPATTDFLSNGDAIDSGGSIATDGNNCVKWTYTANDTAVVGSLQITVTTAGYIMRPFEVDVGLPVVYSGQFNLVVTGSPTPDVTGTYVPAGEYPRFFSLVQWAHTFYLSAADMVYAYSREERSGSQTTPYLDSQEPIRLPTGEFGFSVLKVQLPLTDSSIQADVAAAIAAANLPTDSSIQADAAAAITAANLATSAQAGDILTDLGNLLDPSSSGGTAVIVTCRLSNGQNVSGVTTTLFNDSGMTSQIGGSQISDNAGNTYWSLTASTSYYVKFVLTGITFSNPYGPYTS